MKYFTNLLLLLSPLNVAVPQLSLRPSLIMVLVWLVPPFCLMMCHLPLHGHRLPWPHLSQLVSSYTLFVSFMILLLIAVFLLMVFFLLLVEFGFLLLHNLMLFLPLLCLLMNFHLMRMLIFPLLSPVRIDTLMLLIRLLLLNNVLLMMMMMSPLIHLRRRRTCYYLMRTW